MPSVQLPPGQGQPRGSLEFLTHKVGIGMRDTCPETEVGLKGGFSLLSFHNSFLGQGVCRSVPQAACRKDDTDQGLVSLLS